MAAPIRTLERMLSDLPKREKQRAFSLLAKQLLPAQRRGSFEAIEVLDDTESPVGYFVPLVAINPDDFPPLSPGYAAEVERRAAADEASEPVEDFLQTLTAPIAAGRGARKRAK